MGGGVLGNSYLKVLTRKSESATMVAWTDSQFVDQTTDILSLSLGEGQWTRVS